MENKRIWATFIGILLIALIALAGCSKSSTPHTIPWNGQEIVAVDFISHQEGWLTTRTENDRVSLYHTVNSGAHWDSIRFPDDSQENMSGGAWIHFFNSQEGYMDGNGDHLLFTTDGAKTWSVRPLPGNDHDPDMIQFLGRQNIWELGNIGAAAGSEGADLYYSSDGGNHWQQKAEASRRSSESDLQGICDKSGIWFRNDQQGWVTGICNGTQYYIETTDDAGKTWSMKQVPKLAENESYIWIYPPVFSDSSNGWLLADSGETNAAELLHTTDGGTTWTKAGQYTHFLSLLDTTDARHVWFTQGNTKEINKIKSQVNNTIWMTSDQGKHWSSATLDDIKGIKQLQMVDNRSGWLVTNWPGEFSPEDSHLYRTKDGGQRWTMVD